MRDPRVADDPLFVDDKPGPFAPQVNRDFLGIVGHRRIVEYHLIGTRRLTPDIAQQRVGEAKLLGPRLIRCIEIDTDAQNLGIGGLELGKIKLEGQRFLRSRTGKRPDVEEQDNRLLSQIIGKFDLFGRGGR